MKKLTIIVAAILALSACKKEEKEIVKERKEIKKSF